MSALSLMQQKVLSVLSDSAVKRIPRFSVGANRISGNDLQSLGSNAIRVKGKQVSLDNTLPRNVAVYNSKTDTMRISVDPGSTLDMRAIVLHECTHMVQDSEKMKMTVLDSETMAYVV